MKLIKLLNVTLSVNVNVPLNRSSAGVNWPNLIKDNGNILIYMCLESVLRAFFSVVLIYLWSSK